MNRGKKTKLLLNLDAFGRNFKFRIDKTSTSQKTFCGLFLTVLMVLIIIPYAVFKFQVMKVYGETIITERFYQEYLDERYEVSTATHNFNIAFALVGYGANEDYVGDYSEFGRV